MLLRLALQALYRLLLQRCQPPLLPQHCQPSEHTGAVRGAGVGKSTIGQRSTLVSLLAVLSKLAESRHAESSLADLRLLQQHKRAAAQKPRSEFKYTERNTLCF